MPLKRGRRDLVNIGTLGLADCRIFREKAADDWDDADLNPFLAVFQSIRRKPDAEASQDDCFHRKDDRLPDEVNRIRLLEHRLGFGNDCLGCNDSALCHKAHLLDHEEPCLDRKDDRLRDKDLRLRDKDNRLRDKDNEENPCPRQPYEIKRYGSGQRQSSTC